MAGSESPEKRDTSLSPRPASPPPRSRSPRSPPPGPGRSRSPSPPPRRPSPRRASPRRRSPRPGPAHPRRRRTPPPAPTDEEKQAAAKAEYNRLLNARSGGVYVPPARLRALQAQVQDKTSKEYQRMAWEALKKSINGMVNKATAANMRQIINELFHENLVRGRGLLTQSLIKAQYASLPFTPVYACIAACINSKLPAVGELLLRRLLLRFRKGFRRNDKAVCRSATTFLAHLVNTQVADEMVAAQMLMLLLHHPTDDSVELAVNLTREVGNFLETMNPTILVVVFDRFHHILNEADIDKRTQYAIEVLFQNRKDQFKDHPAVRDDLDLIEEEDQIKHMLELNGKFDDEPTLNIFRVDEHWEENEKEYAKLRREILNESDSEGDDGSDDGSDDNDSADDSADDSSSEDDEQKAIDIKDRTNADLVALRRTIYLTIQSSMNADEAVHKLLAVSIPEGREAELPSMVVECCSQERTYTKFFGLLGERLAKLNRRWATLFEEAFAKYYDTIHRYETNRLRNIACFFGHMLASDAIGWYVLACVHLNEEETTSASRIFIKILFQEMSEALGMAKLNARFRDADADLRVSLEGLFPSGNPRHLRFAINYFTSIGMGVLTEDMRERLQNLPKPAALPAAPASDRSGRSRSRSVSSYSSSYTGSSDSRTPSRSLSRSRSRSRTPYRERRARSYNSPTRSRSRTASLSHSPSRSRSRSYSASRSPPPRNRRSAAQLSPRRKTTTRNRSPLPRSASPAPRRNGRQPAAASRSRRRSRSYSYSSRSYYSRSPPPTAANATAAAAPAPATASSKGKAPARRGRSQTRSVTPPPRRKAARSGRGREASYSRSPRRISRRKSMSASRSPSRSPLERSVRSPLPPVGGGGPAGTPGTRRRRRSVSSASSAGSGVPAKKHRRGD